MPIRDVETRVLREAFVASGLRPVDVARALGWTAPYGKGGQHVADGPRVSRALGLLAHTNGRCPPRARQHVRYETAVALAGAMGVDPVELRL